MIRSAGDPEINMTLFSTAELEPELCRGKEDPGPAHIAFELVVRLSLRNWIRSIHVRNSVAASILPKRAFESLEELPDAAGS